MTRTITQASAKPRISSVGNQLFIELDEIVGKGFQISAVMVATDQQTIMVQFTPPPEIPEEPVTDR